MFRRFTRAVTELYSPNRRSGRAEWLVLLLFSVIVPLVGIPASMRRLRDMDRSPWWTLPLFALVFALIITFVPIRSYGYDAESWKTTMAIPTLIAIAITLGVFIWMCAKGSAPYANAFGEPAERDAAP